MKKKLSILLLASISIGYSLEGSSYNTIVPASSDSPLYYKVGGGNVVPTTPSMNSTAEITVNNLGALGYNCGSFNKGASIANALNGLEDTGMQMYNNVVLAAQGAVMEMPAYVISKANPGLYQVIQNGFFSGQWDITTGLKSCQQMADDIDQGKNPYDGMFNASQYSKYKAFQTGSASKTNLNQLTYTQATNSDVTTASKKVAEDNGRSGVPWMHGTYIDGSKHAGGFNQDAIYMTKDIVVAGVNAMIGRNDFASNTAIPADDGLSAFFKTPQDAADWAVKALGENKVYVYTDPVHKSSATPGQGLLPLVQKQYNEIYKNLSDMVTGSKPITLDNIKSISSTRIMINVDTINAIKNENDLTRDFEISTLAQGVASSRVVDQAQELIIILQTAMQVPDIAINQTAKDFIDQYITTLQKQIDLIVKNNETSQKLITSSIQAFNENNQKQVIRGNIARTGNAGKPVVDGVMQR